MGQAPFRAAWKKRASFVRHVFTHFELEIEVYAAEVSRRPKHLHLCHPRPSEARGRGPRRIDQTRSDHLGPLPSPLRGSPGMTAVVWEKEMTKVALPTVMRKIVAHAFADDGPLFARRR